MIGCTELDPVLIEDHLVIACPHCHVMLSRISSDRVEIPDGKPWLHDGDCLQVRSRLSAEQRDRASYTSVMTGRCKSCEADYAVFDVALLPGPFTQEGEKFAYLLGNIPGVDRRYYRVSCDAMPDGPGQSWHLARSLTPFGILDFHSFGPVRMESDDSIQTEYGTSACGGDSDVVELGLETVIPLWESLCRLNDRVQHSEMIPLSSGKL